MSALFDAIVGIGGGYSQGMKDFYQQQENYQRQLANQSAFWVPLPSLDGQPLSSEEEEIIRKFREKKQRQEEYELSLIMAL